MTVHARTDEVARAELIVSAARIARDDSAVGDPETILNAVVSPSLTLVRRDRWFGVLVVALDDVVAHIDRAVLAVLVLIYGEPTAGTYAWASA